MSAHYVERSTAIVDRIEGLELVPHAVRLSAEGEPVALDRLAAAAGRSLEDVEAASAICQHGQFFASPQAAAQWAAQHPEGEIRPVEEAFALDRAVVTQLGWADR